MIKVFWDTNLFIYLFEHSEASTLARELRRLMLARKAKLITSTMTIAEIQVGPRRSGDYNIAEQYREVIPQISTVIPFDLEAADQYAQIRERYPALRGPDGVQLACAATGGANFFVTNDARLQRVHLDQTVIVSLEISLQIMK